MELNNLSMRAHENAVKKGFWDGHKLTREHCLMLIITEIAEMVEADRHDRHADIEAYKTAMYGTPESAMFPEIFEKYIKDTVEDECADIAIRLLDLSGAMRIDFDHVKRIDYYRDFPHFSMTENAFALTKGLAKENISIIKRIAFAFQYLDDWSKAIGFNLDEHVRLKMKYNESRSIRHGKKY